MTTDPKAWADQHARESFERSEKALAEFGKLPKPAAPSSPAAPAVLPELAEARAQLAAMREERAHHALELALSERGVDRAHHAKAIKYARAAAKEWTIDSDGDLYLVDDDGRQHFTADAVADHIVGLFPKLRGDTASEPKQEARSRGRGPGGRPLHELSASELVMLSRPPRPTAPPREQARTAQRLAGGRPLHELSHAELALLSRRGAR